MAGMNYPWAEKWWSDMSDADCDNATLTEFVLDVKKERAEGLPMRAESYDFVVHVVGVQE